MRLGSRRVLIFLAVTGLSVFLSGFGPRPPAIPIPPICREAWTTVDDFLSPGDTGSQANGIASGSRGIFAVGKVDRLSTGASWTVRRSTDGGLSWRTVDQLSGTSMARGVAIDSRNNAIYVVGTDSRVVGKTQWLVRKSTDNGATWRTVDQFSDSAAEGAGVMAARSVSVDGSGIVYAAGTATFFAPGSIRAKWITRRSADGGSTWRTVDTMEPATGAEALAVVASPGGRVWVGGTAGELPNTTWIVRYSRNGSTDWRLVDEYKEDFGIVTAARGAALRPDGHVVFVGEAGIGGKRTWVARKSYYEEPDKWSITDQFVPDPGAGAARAAAFTRASGARLYITGEQWASDGIGLLTRRGRIETNTFTRRDLLVAGPPARNYAAGFGMTVDPGNDAFSAGVYQRENVSRWIVRKLQCLF